MKLRTIQISIYAKTVALFIFLSSFHISTAQDALFIKPNGNVGIGLAQPAEILHLKRPGSDNYIKLESGGPSSTYAGLKLYENGYNFGWTMRMDSKTDKLFFSHQNNSSAIVDKITFSLDGSANFNGSIRASSANIAGTTKLKGDNVRVENNGESDIRYVDTRNNQNWQVGTNQYGFYIYDNAYRLVVTKGSGNVGIGVNNPQKAKLEVSQGGKAIPMGAFGYFFVGGATKRNGGNWVNNSIYAQGNVLAREYLAFSDKRIKNIKGRSDSKKDLMTLINIEVTDYTYIDTLSKGNKLEKKLIGQQLAKIYPQAISLSTDEVPDVYKIAKIEKGWINLPTNFVKGEIIQLIFKEKKELFKVIEIREGAFRINSKFEGEVFVYGRQVNDFHTVDYESIAMLNVSATQEIAKQTENLKTQNKEQAKLITDLQQQIANLNKQVNKLESLQATVELLLSKSKDLNSIVSED